MQRGVSEAMKCEDCPPKHIAGPGNITDIRYLRSAQCWKLMLFMAFNVTSTLFHFLRERKNRETGTRDPDLVYKKKWH